MANILTSRNLILRRRETRGDRALLPAARHHLRKKVHVLRTKKRRKELHPDERTTPLRLQRTMDPGPNLHLPAFLPQSYHHDPGSATLKRPLEKRPRIGNDLAGRRIERATVPLAAQQTSPL